MHIVKIINGAIDWINNPDLLGRFAPSSPSNPSSGRAAKIASVINFSDALSICVTISIAEVLVSIDNCAGLSKRSEPASFAIFTARSSKSFMP
jgi:hypothetical protein